MKKKLFCRCVYMSITAITVLLVVCTCALAADIDLGEGYHVPQNFTSVLIESSDGTAIQNAVENIQPNGIIVLASGTFNLKEQINIKKNLTIRGQGSILKMDKSDRVFRCQGNITLESLDISGGSSTNGGGIKLDGGNVIIKDCKIHDNNGGLGGGGIYSMAKTLTLTSCDISNNTLAGLGGGIAFLGGTATITNCTITSNDTKTFGGGIAAAGATITMSNSKVSGNKAEARGDNLQLIVKTTLTATSCDIPAGGNYIYINDSTFTNN